MGDDERRAYALVVPMTPLDVEVRFASPEAWMVEGGGEGSGGITPVWEPARPCRVVVPAQNFEILSIPAVGAARWRRDSMGTTLAHEIMHCLRGAWHPAWSDIPREKLDQVYAPILDPLLARPGGQ